MGTPPEKLGVPLELGASLHVPFEEQPAGRLRPVLENLSLLWPALEETLITGGQQMARLMEDITLRMESSLALLLAQQQQMEEVMEKLWQMNQSLGLALVAVEGARNQVENHLQHLQHVQDQNGQRPSVISTCILHGSYFVLLVVLLVPTLPRAILLLLFLTSSILAELLGISALLALLVLAVAGKWLFVATSCGAGGACLVFPPEKPCPWLTSTPEREHELKLLQELDKMEMSCLQEPSCLEQPPAMAGEVPNLAGQVSSICGASSTKLSYAEMLEVATGTEKHWEPKPYSPSRSLTSNMSLRSQCQGLTRVGQLCRKKAIPGQDFCYVHTTS
ncbi:protein brambleberry-like isoform X2 [Cuculus canorus]|uniref:protein brambleberry-like isoform X2 n=1 Tax=Cuculus canorus TaxID=55661 RepID=UPI0023AB0BB2|nr:protein brambleberry-like isoform X2 [Cuculus canorus]